MSTELTDRARCGSDRRIAFHLRSVGHLYDQRGSQGEEHGVRIAELDIPAGAIVAVLGGSGSGKSTLLNLLGGLIKPKRLSPQAGQNGARLDMHWQAVVAPRWWHRGAGRRLKDRTLDLLPSRWRLWPRRSGRRAIGFVFQSGHLIGSAPISTNIGLAAAIAGRGNAPEAVARLMARLDLANITPDQRARTISGGEAQRTALARALAAEPCIVLADEPTAALDPNLGRRVMADLVLWQRGDDAAVQPGRTVIWVTHNLEQAALFADEVIVLHKGVLAAGIWPRPNPRDPAVLEKWIDGQLAATTAPDSPVARDMLGKADTYIDNARERASQPPLAHAATRISLAGALRRTAISYLFSAPFVDRNGAPGWLRRATSMAHIGQPIGPSRDVGKLALAGLGLLGTAAALHGGWLGLGTGAAGVAPVLALAGAGLFLLPLLSRTARSFARYGDVAVLLLLLMFLGGTLRTWAAVDEIFRRRLASPELSHVVLKQQLFQRGGLTDKELGRFRTELERVGLPAEQAVEPPHNPTLGGLATSMVERIVAIAPALKPLASSAGWQTPPSVSRREPTVFGRWDAPLQVARRASAEGRDPDVVCPKASESSAPPVDNLVIYRREAVAVRGDEPLWRSLAHSGPAPGDQTWSLARLVPRSVAASPMASVDLYDRTDGLHGVTVTRAFLASALLYRRDESIDRYFCLEFESNWHVVRIDSVVDGLPNDHESDYHLLLEHDLFMHMVKKADEGRQLTDKRPFQKLAMYLVDAEQSGRFESYDRFLREQAEKTTKGRSALEQETTLSRVRSALALGEQLRLIALAGALVATIVTLVLVIYMAVTYILENERALCVLKAFGLRAGSIFRLLLWQMLALWIAAFGLLAAVLTFGWPHLLDRLGTSQDVRALMQFPALDLVWVAVYSLGGVLFGCVLAVVWWAGQSRWVAQRLQQLTA